MKVPAESSASGLQGKGLRQKGRVSIEYFLDLDMIGRVSGHKQHPDVGLIRLTFNASSRPFISGMTMSESIRSNLPRASSTIFNASMGFSATLTSYQATPASSARDPYKWLVLDQQDPLAIGGTGSQEIRNPVHLPGSRNVEDTPEGRPASRFAGHGNKPALCLTIP